MKIAIIGSGVAGLAASIRLARLGHRVDLFEAGPLPGGKLGSLQLGKYRFDTGPSLFTLPNLVEELLEKEPENQKVEFNYKKLNNLCNYWFSDGRTFNAPADPTLFVKEFSEKFDCDSNSVKKYLSFYRKTHQIIAPVFLEQSLHVFKNYFNKTTFKGFTNLWRLRLFSSMNKIQQRYFKDPNAVQFFNRYATYNGSNPYIAPSTLNVISQLEISDGAYLPQNGMQDISRALFEQAKKLGVNFHFNSPVKKITHHKNKICGIIGTDGAEYECEAVFSNIDAKKTYRHLLNEEPPAKIVKAENSSSALIFYWGIKHSFPQLDLHNIFFSENYEQEFRHLFESKDITADPTIYINITSKHVTDDAPEGGENWFVMINAPANYGQNWETLRINARASILQKLSRVLKTDIKSLIEAEDYLDPLRIEERTGSDRGSLYGTSSNSINSAFLRHANFSSGIKGLYFCGGSVHPGGGIPLALLSARIATDIFSKRNPQ